MRLSCHRALSSRVALLLTLVGTTSGACVRLTARQGEGSAEDPAWVVARSPHFEVYAQLSAEVTDRLVRFLEDARTALITEAWKIDFRLPGAPIRVVAACELKRYGGTAIVAGNVTRASGFEALGQGPIIFLDADPSLSHYFGFVVLHEVTHAVHGALGLALPRWLEEGLASYFEAMVLDRRREVAEVGTVAGPFYRQANKTAPLTIKELEGWSIEPWTPHAGKHDWTSYSQYTTSSWLLVHYLMSEEREQLRELQGRLLAGEPWSRAWQELFAPDSSPTIDERVSAYWSRRRLPSREVSVAFADWPMQNAGPVPAAEEQAVRMLLYQHVAGPRPEKDRLRRIQEALEAGFAADPTNMVLLETALPFMEPRLREARVSAARQVHPRNWRLALLHSFTLEPAPAAGELEQALRHAPREPYLEAALASAYMALGRQADSVRLADQAALREPKDEYIFKVRARAHLGSAAASAGDLRPLAVWPSVEQRREAPVPPGVVSRILRFHTQGLGGCAPEQTARSYQVTALVDPEGGAVAWLELETRIGDGDPLVEGCVRNALAKARFPRRSAEYVARGLVLLDVTEPRAAPSTGLRDKEEIRSVIRSAAAEAKSCYEADLVLPPFRGGQVVTHFSIEAGGRVLGVILGETTLQRPAVEACIAGVILGLTFPPKDQTGTTPVRYPFDFTPAR